MPTYHINPVNHNNPVYTTLLFIHSVNSTCHLICSQSLDFTAFDRIINIQKPSCKCQKTLEIRAFLHTYSSTLDINTTHSTCDT